jgi:hypothetical protein
LFPPPAFCQKLMSLLPIVAEHYLPWTNPDACLPYFSAIPCSSLLLCLFVLWYWSFNLGPNSC